MIESVKVSLHWRSLALVSACLLAGCGRGDCPELAKVTGTVTRSGKPVPDLLVHFIPDDGRPSWGLTDAQGRFKLYYTPEEDGARLGEHTVYVAFNQAQPHSFAGTGEAPREKVPDVYETVDESTPSQAKPEPSELSAEDRRDIIEKYGDPTKTRLRVTIEKSRQSVEISLD